MKYADYDDYIGKAQPFAQPLLKFFRACVLEACPSVTEEFKWSMPCFTYHGSILCNMAAFKNHVSFGFWLQSHMKDHAGLFAKDDNSGMGQLGKISSEADLPDRSILIAYIHEAMLLTDQGIKITTGKEGRKTKVLEAPDYLLEELKKHEKAMATFDNFSQSHKNEYIEWITEAKTEPTRIRRMAQMVEWLEEGKQRNWKYVK